MTATAVEICARALVMLGAAPISSFTDGTTEATICNTLYPGVRDSLLSGHRWNFAVGQISLPALVAVPVADFSYAYQLPVDYLRALSVGTSPRGAGVPYRISERRIHCDAGPPCVLTYIFRPDESTFPPWFTQALAVLVAANICQAVTDNTNRAQQMWDQADSEITRCRTINGQEQTPAGFGLGPLILARF
jgi:hypothetical protein